MTLRAARMCRIQPVHRNGEWEQEYRKRLRLFKVEHGLIREEYWCRYEASGVLLTEKRLPRTAVNFFRRDAILRLHAATDWRTANATVVATYLHQWYTAGIKASEMLRGTSERIALHRVFGGMSRLLGFVDRDKTASGPTWADMARVLAAQDRELAEVDGYYLRAGNNSARIVYFRGMAWGTAFLGAAAGAAVLGGWLFGWLDPRDQHTYTLAVTIALGAAGAVLSVMTRMARPDGFSLDSRWAASPCGSSEASGPGSVRSLRSPSTWRSKAA